MSQISLRLPEEDVKFLTWISKRRAIPMTTLYREVTHEAFRQWKLETILKEYSSGVIGLKKAWQLSGMTFPEFLYVLEKSEIEPPHTELMELKSEEHIQKLDAEDFFREDVGRKRKTPEVIPEE